MQGVLPLDKPPGISSARAVSQVKRLLPRGTKIGHAGALDPFATGLLLLLVGKATKLCERLMDEPKQYETTIKLGANTATDDPESPEEPREILAPPSPDQIESALKSFVGSIQQQPPIYSALKINGRRACDLVRQGHDVTLKPRTVQIYSIDLLKYDWPLLSLRIDCGRGTYIRAIARDLGETLATGGYLTTLRRTRVGPFAVTQALPIERVVAEGVERSLHPYPPSEA